MTAIRHMPIFSFFAEASSSAPPLPEGMPPWLTAILYLGGGGMLTGVFAYLRDKIMDNRRAIEIREARDREERHEESVAGASVDIARVTAKAELESKYFSALEKEREERAAEMRDLREEFNQSKKTLGHEIRNLRNSLNLTQEVYNQLWTACNMLALQCRIMRARIKKQDGDKFDESEFPLVVLEIFDPKNLFAKINALHSPLEDVVADPRKMSGHITITPDHPA